MRIHLVGPLPPPHGGATITCELFREELEANGREYGVSRITWSDISPKRYRRSHDISGRDGAEIGWRLVRVCSAMWRADAVVCFVSERWFLLLSPALLTLRLCRMPVVVRFFGHSTGTWLRAHRGPLRMAAIAALRRMTGVFVEAAALVDDLRHLGIDAVQNRNFRRIGSAALARTTAAPSRCRVVFLGAISRQKGALDLIDAVEAVEGDRVVCDFWGVIAPVDTETFTAKISRSTRCRFRGAFVGETQTLLRDYEVLALPSYHAGEGHSGAVIEAMAAGIPAVVTDHQGLPDLIEDGRNGRVVPPRCVTALSQALAELAADRTRREEMGMENRRRAADFDIAINVAQLIAPCLGGRVPTTGRDHGERVCPSSEKIRPKIIGASEPATNRR